MPYVVEQWDSVDLNLDTAPYAIPYDPLALVLDLADDLVDMARAMISVMEAIVLPMRAHTTSEVYQTLGVLARTMMRAYTKQPVLVELFRKI